MGDRIWQKVESDLSRYFWHASPAKNRDTVPATPLQRIAIADCFEGLRKFLGEARFDYYDFNDFDIGGLF